MFNVVKFIVLSTVVAAMLCSCSTDMDFPDEPSELGMEIRKYSHYLELGFQDTSGHDLAREFIQQPDAIITTDGNGRLINPDLYTLRVVFEDEILNSWKQHSELLPNNSVMLFTDSTHTDDTNGNFVHLIFSTFSYKYYFDSNDNKTLYPFAEKIIFKLACPYLFGDDAEHDIVTRWERSNPYHSTTCTHIELDGKKVAQATVTL